MRVVVMAILALASASALAGEPVKIQGEDTRIEAKPPAPVALTIARQQLTENEVELAPEVRPADKVVLALEDALF